MNRRTFALSLAALPFIGKLIRNPTGPVVPSTPTEWTLYDSLPSRPYEPPTLTRVPLTSADIYAAMAPVAGRYWFVNGNAEARHAYANCNRGDTIVVMPHHREDLS